MDGKIVTLYVATARIAENGKSYYSLRVLENMKQTEDTIIGNRKRYRVENLHTIKTSNTYGSFRILTTDVNQVETIKTQLIEHIKHIATERVQLLENEIVNLKASIQQNNDDVEWLSRIES